MRANYLSALKLPIVTTIFSYLLILVNMKLFPVMVVSGDVLFGYPFIAIIFTLVGGWAGYKIAEFGENFVGLLLVSVIIGAVVGVLQIVEVGVLVSLPASINLSSEMPTVVYNFFNAFFGALAAGGFVLTK